MPLSLSCEDTSAIGLTDCLDMLGERPFDPADEASLENGTLALRRLANNRDFLGDMLVEQLADRHREIGEQSAYGPQAIVLSNLREGSFLRANIWPSERDACFQTSGAKTFVYGVPHDHNFSFLTAGYFGPGYASDYYEYDYEAAAGFIGEKPELRFVERSALHEGKLALYRAHKDIHSQLTPESMSVSLNIMHIDPAQGWFDQYGFELESGEITGVLNPTSTECFLRCAVGLGSEDALDLASHFGQHHPSDRMRLASFEARVLQTDYETADALWCEAERSGSRLVSTEASTRRRALEAA